jgi:hypothetical protein
MPNSTQKEKQNQKQKKNARVHVINPADRKVAVNISMKLRLLDKLDEHCADNDRSAFVCSILEKELHMA